MLQSPYYFKYIVYLLSSHGAIYTWWGGSVFAWYTLNFKQSEFYLLLEDLLQRNHK